MNIKNF